MIVSIPVRSFLAAVGVGAAVLAGCDGPSYHSQLAGPTWVRSGLGLPKAVVTGTLAVSQSRPAPDEISYVFALQLTESSGVPAKVTALWIDFDNGFGGQCIWAASELGQTRLPANGTLALGPLVCASVHGKAFNVVVAISLKDDNGHAAIVEMRREL